MRRLASSHSLASRSEAPSPLSIFLSAGQALRKKRQFGLVELGHYLSAVYLVSRRADSQR